MKKLYRFKLPIGAEVYLDGDRYVVTQEIWTTVKCDENLDFYSVTKKAKQNFQKVFAKQWGNIKAWPYVDIYDRQIQFMTA